MTIATINNYMGLSITNNKAFVSDLSSDSITYTVLTNSPYKDIGIRLTSHPENFLEIKQSADSDWATVGDEMTRLGPWHDHENDPDQLQLIHSSESEQFTFSLRKTSQQMDVDSVNVVLVLTATDSDSQTQDFVVTFTIKRQQESWKPKELPLKPGHAPLVVNDYTYNDWLKDITDRINRDSNGTYKVCRLKGGTVEIKGQDRSYDYGLFVYATTPGAAGNNIQLATSGHGVLLANTLTAGADKKQLDNSGAGGNSIDGIEFITFGTNSGSIVGDRI